MPRLGLGIHEFPTRRRPQLVDARPKAWHDVFRASGGVLVTAGSLVLDLGTAVTEETAPWPACSSPMSASSTGAIRRPLPARCWSRARRSPRWRATDG